MKNAKETTWITEGLTTEEIAEIVRDAKEEAKKVDLIIELEKIKDEMMNDGAYFQEVEGHTDFVKGISHCINIVEKELTELKGGQNDK